MSDKIKVINRGDTLKFYFTIMDFQNTIYRLKDNDAVYLGLMDPKQHFEDALLKFKFTAKDQDKDGNILIHFKPEDTLDLFPGTYYYAIKLHRYSKKDKIDEVYTLQNKAKFIIND